jgi:hypothetical protein
MVDSTKYLNAVQSFVEIAGPTAPREKKDQSKAENPQATINIDDYRRQPIPKCVTTAFPSPTWEWTARPS